MRSSFDKIIGAVLDVESGFDPSGGFHHDPHDPGGPTKWGIAEIYNQEELRQLGLGAFGGVQGLTRAQAIDLYLKKYWLGACDELPWPLDAVLFDDCVNEGALVAVRLLQRAIGLPRSSQTGFFGPITRHRVGIMAETPYFLEHYLAVRCDHYAQKGNTRFDEGWMFRILFVHRDILVQDRDSK